MKRIVLLLLTFFLLLFLNPVDSCAQKRYTGNWKKCFSTDDDGGIDSPYYVLFLQGRVFEENGYTNERVKLLVKVDKAVVDGLSLAVIDENSDIVYLGQSARVNITKDWETSTSIGVDKVWNGIVCIIRTRPHLNRLMDFLCEGFCTIILGNSNEYGDNKL